MIPRAMACFAVAVMNRPFYLDPNDQSKPGIVELSEADEAKNIDIRVGTARRPTTVSGRVVDSETGVPISKAASVSR